MDAIGIIAVRAVIDNCHMGQVDCTSGLDIYCPALTSCTVVMNG